MRPVFFFLSIFIATAALVLSSSAGVQAQTAHEDFRWASAGGGWRAMVADMAYANVLSQAGLFTNTSSNFSSISAQSGGSWFLGQFFFADAFYNNVTQTTPDELAQFVTSWMDSYKKYTLQFEVTTTDDIDDNNNTTTTTTTAAATKCDHLNAINVILQSPFIQAIIDHCVLFVALQGDWARFVSEMLDQAAADYLGIIIPSSNGTANNDDGAAVFNLLSTTQAAPGSRVLALQQTDFYVQTVLVPMSRIRGSNNTNASSTGGDSNENEQPDIGVYVGHSQLEQDDDDDSVYTLGIGLQYQISDAQGTGYLTSSPDESFPDVLVTYTADISPAFSFNDYQSYDLYPANSSAGGLTMRMSVPLNATLVSDGLKMPFDGNVPTIGQLCGASSAAIGILSGLVPSTLALVFSPLVYNIANPESNQTDEEMLQAQVLEAAISAAFYEDPMFDDVAVCSQWPNSCGASDGRFIDGEFSDSPTLGLNIAHYQTVQNGALSQTLKILVTPSNLYGGSTPIGFVSYFENSFNQDIEPGDYYWPSIFGIPLMALPIYSPQIFQETLDIDTYLARLQPIDGLPDVSTMTIQATTITNPIFKTKASQPVEILVIQLNSSIPTDIMGVASIEKWTGPLAEMASSIAASQELVNRVKEFFDPSTSAPTTATPGGPASSNDPVPSPSLRPATAATTRPNGTTMEPTIAPAPEGSSSAISMSLSALVGLVSRIMTMTVMVSAML